MINLTIDGKAISVPKGTTVYNAAKQLGIDVPIFCYQDRMPPFGACRMCLVEVEKMPKLQTSCTLEASEGMVVKTQSQIALDGRKEIVELLLINHPLDCPICDRGGECPLQENAIKHGPGLSRFFEEKRHFKKALPLGPVLMLDRERCIVCARCTRFGEVIAGDHALEFIDRGYKTEVGTPDGKPAESKFIGNTIQICPVGALTSQVYRFRARPWDNDSTQSTCTLCPVGCSMTLDSRDGEIMRTRSTENKDVNDIWLCDKGWFGYEFTSHPDRLQTPLIRKKNKLEPATWEEALTLIADKIKKYRVGEKIAAFGGNPLTFEENHLFQDLIRKAASVHHVDHRIGMPIIPLKEEGVPPGMEMSIGESEELAYAFLIGVDLTEEFPVIWLRLRQAINKGAKVIFIGHFAPEMSRYLSKTILHAPGKELDMLKEHLPQISALAQNGAKGALFVGRQYLASKQRLAIADVLLKVKKETPHLKLNILEGRGNSLGARLAGMHPEIGPGGKLLKAPGLSALQVLEEAVYSHWHFLYVAGANPALKYPTKFWQTVRTNLDFLVVQDLFLTETAKDADVVLPTLSFIEKGGTFINIEGRRQRLQPGKMLPSGLYSDGEIFNMIAQKLNVALEISSEEGKNSESRIQNSDERNTEGRNSESRIQNPEGRNEGKNSESRIQNSEGRNEGKNSESRIQNSEGRNEGKNSESRIQNSEGRNEGKNADGGMKASFAPALFDHGVRMKHDTQLIQLAKEPAVRINFQEGSKRGIQEGELVRLSANGKSITAKIHLDERVANNTIVLPLGFEQIPTREFGPNLLNGIDIAIVKENS